MIDKTDLAKQEFFVGQGGRVPLAK